MHNYTKHRTAYYLAVCVDFCCYAAHRSSLISLGELRKDKDIQTFLVCKTQSGRTAQKSKPQSRKHPIKQKSDQILVTDKKI